MEAVHVVGAGGIGCAVGHALCTTGVAVTFVDADPEKVEWGRRHGGRVGRLPPRPAEFVPFAEWRPPPGALVLLCTKCYDNAAVLARVPASVRLVPIQNGFDPALAARAHAVEGIASFVSECLPHRTHTRITRRGHLHIGPAGDGGAEARSQAATLAAWLRRAPFRVRVVEAIRPYKYTKLMYNAALSPLASAAGIDNGELLRRPRIRGLFFDLLRENHAILQGAGVPLGKVGPLHPTTVAAILRRPRIAHALAWAFYPTLRRTYCSMSADLPAGRTEIDFYNGHLIDLAGDTPCPLNRRVCALVKRMERERIVPHPAALDELRSPLAAQTGPRSHSRAEGDGYTDTARRAVAPGANPLAADGTRSLPIQTGL
jgi:2-dehydropantoate 2-reductase